MTSQENPAAERFRRLHSEGLLVLPNAWDAGSARLIESLGAKAIATTSAGVAWSHGYPDGDTLPLPLLRATVADIARAVRVPVSTDVEGGYSNDPAAVGETVAAVIEAGAVGINIEDGSGATDLLCAKIERAKNAAERLGVDLFVNARTDVYLRGLAAKERRVEETLARAERYRSAGADGIFVPGLRTRTRSAPWRRVRLCRSTSWPGAACRPRPSWKLWAFAASAREPASSRAPTRRLAGSPPRFSREAPPTP
jgi:2-methylisocitrate lyase-like PEP mutase family enzyme